MEGGVIDNSKGYIYDKDESVIENLPVYNCEEHFKWLLSKKKAKQIKSEDDLPETGLLDPVSSKEFEMEVISLSSVGRSGNSFARGFIEKITRIYTGSACRFRYVNGMAMNGGTKTMEDMGMLGEGVYDRRVWVIKTHCPENC